MGKPLRFRCFGMLSLRVYLLEIYCLDNQSNLQEGHSPR